MSSATEGHQQAENPTDVVCALPPAQPEDVVIAVEPWEGVEGYDRRRSEEKMTSGTLSEPPAPVAVSPSPEWHTLRLFGRGRHPRAFESGNERDGDL